MTLTAEGEKQTAAASHSVPEDLVEREARLFEAGDYPDKGLSVSPDDLDRMAGGFQAPAPIQMEHTAGPLRFGWLVHVWRDGAALFGKLAFTRAAWELLKESGARSLSVGLDRATLAIREVSLVRQPRVAGARVFSDEALVCFTVELDADLEPQKPAEDSALLENARQTLRTLQEAGKVAPAASEFALALLSAPQDAVVRFGEGQGSGVAGVFRRFMEAQGPVIVFGELAPAAPGGKTCSPEDRRLFDALGITPDDLEKVKQESEA